MNAPKRRPSVFPNGPTQDFSSSAAARMPSTPRVRGTALGLFACSLLAAACGDGSDRDFNSGTMGVSSTNPSANGSAAPSNQAVGANPSTGANNLGNQTAQDNTTGGVQTSVNQVQMPPQTGNTGVQQQQMPTTNTTDTTTQDPMTGATGSEPATTAETPMGMSGMGAGGMPGTDPMVAMGGTDAAGGDTMDTTTEPEPAPGGDLPPNPSGLPEPGEGGMSRPSGAAGGLTVLPWAGFTGAMTYSFDDANSSQINNAEQMLGLEVPFTFYLQTGKQEAGNDFYQRALDAGHELANHTQNHGSGAADNDVNQAQQFIMNTYGLTAFTMAAPNGNNGTYTNIAGQLFIIDRGVSDRLIGPDDNVDLLNLPTYIPPTGAGAGQLNPKADAAQSQGKWQTFCIHGFSGGSDGAYQPIDLSGWVQHVQYVKDKGDLWIGTMEDVGAYFIGRKAVVAAQPQTDGDDQVYNWTLPDVFPPGHYVRVMVDGGTLSQDGTPLPWNEHGFYEVALDAGSLTISP